MKIEDRVWQWFKLDESWWKLMKVDKSWFVLLSQTVKTVASWQFTM